VVGHGSLEKDLNRIFRDVITSLLGAGFVGRAMPLGADAMMMPIRPLAVAVDVELHFAHVMTTISESPFPESSLAQCWPR